MTLPDRVAFTLFGKDIYWYGVLMACGIIIAVLLAMLEEKRKKLKKDTVIDMCLVVIPCGVVGARLYYVLFRLEHYLANPISIFYVWEGGLAIYGAVIAGLFGAFIFSLIRKVRFLKLADCIMPGLALAQAIGRWGNFFNQEAFGLPVTAEMAARFLFMQYFPLAVGIEGTHYFEDAACTACMTGTSGIHLHMATFFYESVWCLLIFLVLWSFRKKFKHDGDALVCYAGLYAFERMFVEGLRGDSLYLIQPGAAAFAGGIRVSQLISAAALVTVIVFVVIRTVREKKLNALIWPKPETVTEQETPAAEQEAIPAEGDLANTVDIPSDEESAAYEETAETEQNEA
ncbi:MAG: prolipoprotein diacylglyceryl transferase [Clostridiales bacterium]|nr:prolipoprotein diacylglyceryl transferase [Clostridiales bacterium]